METEREIIRGNIKDPLVCEQCDKESESGDGGNKGKITSNH